MFKFAIIGCGSISKKHAENISNLAQLVAVCDIDNEKAEALARQYNSKAYSTIDGLLTQEKDIDIITVCTPNGFHAEHIIKSLQAGKHVLCEQPLCITGAAAWQIIETEKFSGKQLFVVNSTIHNRLLQDVKKIIDDNLLGKVYNFGLNCFLNRPSSYYKGWRGKKFPAGGLLYTDLSSHIDAILYLYGDPLEIKGTITNAGHQMVTEFENAGEVELKMRNNVLGTINWSIDTFEKKLEIELIITAGKGTMIIGGENLTELKYHCLENSFSFSPNGSNMDWYKEIYKHVITSLKNEDYSLSGAFDGLKTVETIERIYKAVNTLSPAQ